MRPRKRIAVLGATKLECSLLRVVLHTRRYNVEIFADVEAASTIATPACFLLVGMGRLRLRQTIERLDAAHTGHGIVCVERYACNVREAWMTMVVERLRRCKKPNGVLKTYVRAIAPQLGETVPGVRRPRLVA